MLKKMLLVSIITLLVCQNASATLIDGWNISLKKQPKIIPVLMHQEEIETYTGDIALYDSTQKPTKNYLYVLATLEINHTPQAKAFLNPEEIILNVGTKTYKRINLDDFIEKFKYTPLPHLKLKKGSFTGTLIYEIPQNEQDMPLSIMYQNNVISDK